MAKLLNALQLLNILLPEVLKLIRAMNSNGVGKEEAKSMVERISRDVQEGNNEKLKTTLLSINDRLRQSPKPFQPTTQR